MLCKTTFTVIGKRLLDLFTGIHHKRSTASDRFIQGLTRNQQKLTGLFSVYGDRITSFEYTQLATI